MTYVDIDQEVIKIPAHVHVSSQDTQNGKQKIVNPDDSQMRQDAENNPCQFTPGTNEAYPKSPT